MTDVELSLTFFHDNHSPISNDELFQIRTVIAEVLQRADFGFMYHEDNTWENLYAHPVHNDYFDPENELYILYRWSYPLEHGDIGALASDGLPFIVNTANMHYGLHTITRLSFINLHVLRLPGEILDGPNDNDEEN